MKYLSIDGRRSPLFKDLIEKWDHTLREFENVMSVEDLPYVYGERTNLGLLAVASAQVGFIALEEYRTEKKGKYGRSDLWLYNGVHSVDISIEAKFCELSWNSKIVAQKLKKLLDAAVDNAEVTKKYEGATYSLGIAFIRPYNADPNQFISSTYWNQISNRSLTDADFCAMHLCRKDIWTKQKYAKGYPGIVMAGKFC